MIEIRQTETYAKWFAGLRDRKARARIDVRIRRLSLGSPGDVKPVGSGVSELRIDYGPGYRVFFATWGNVDYPACRRTQRNTRSGYTESAGIGTRSLEVLMRKKTAKLKTRPWDAAEHLTTEEDMAAYLEAALEDGAPALIAAALVR